MYLKDFANPANFPKRVRELPEKFLALPDFSSMPRGEFSGSAPFQATLELVAHTLLQEILVGYDKNRGNQPIRMSQIRRWFGNNGDGLCVEAIGEIAFGESKDRFTLAKCHHRACLIMYLYWMAPDEVWNKIKNEIISCRVYDVSKLVKLYITDNDLTKQNKASFLKNSDMLLGNVLSSSLSSDGKFDGRLFQKLSVPARTLISSKNGFLQPIANLLYALHVKTCTYANKVVDLLNSQSSVYNCRHKVKKFVELSLKDNEYNFSISDEHLDSVAAAIEDYIMFLSFFKMEIEQQRVAGTDVTLHKKIISQTAFFAFFIYDRVVFKLLPPSHQVAERLAYHCNGSLQIGEEINSLWNNDSVFINKRADKIVSALRKRIPAKKK